MIKKYLVLPILLLSCNAFAEVTKEDIKVMRKDVQGMSKQEVSAKHIELLSVVKAVPNEKNCDAFGVFEEADRKEKKLELLDFEANERTFSGQNICGSAGFIF